MNPHGNGSAPVKGAVVKLTAVPSGAGPPVFSITVPVTEDVPPRPTIEGVAVTEDRPVEMVTGLRKRDVRVEATLLSVNTARAVIFRTVCMSVRTAGFTWTRTDACPFMSVVAVLPWGNMTLHDVLPSLHVWATKLVLKGKSEPKVTEAPGASTPSRSRTVALTTL